MRNGARMGTKSTISRARRPEAAYCWRCGVWLPDPQSDYGCGDGRGDGDGDGDGNGWGNGWGLGGRGYGDGGGDDGNGYGDGRGYLLPLCDDTLACAIRQARRPA